MRRRSLITLAILVTVVLTAALLPQTPAGRGWILEQVRTAAASAGWTLTWSDSGGNPWREIELIDAHLEGPGVDARLDRARVSWFVPGLLTGDLPLWIEAHGGRVDVDANAFEAPEGGGGGGLPIRPEIRAIDLQDVEVAVGDAPYTLPDLRAEDLRVSGRGAGATVSGRLVSPEGSLAFDADVATSPFRIEAELTDVDARLGRTWWRGVTGGTAEGTARWDENGLRVDLDVREGSIEAGGIDVRDIEGTAAFASGLVTAELSGEALGGPVAATGRVDVDHRTWNASVRGTPRLGQATRRFAPDAWPEDLIPSGEALVTARASGWTHVEVTGSVDATGTLDGRPLSLRGDDVRYVRGEGLQADLTGEALGGEARVRTGSGVPEGWRIELADASYGPANGLDGEAVFRPGGSPLLTFLASGDVGDAADLTVDGSLEDGDLSTFVSGTLRPEGQVEGAVSLTDGELTGALRIDGWTGAGGSPLTAELEADGPLASLPITLRILGDEPWTPRLGAAEVDADLRGTVRAVYEEGVLRDVEGDLGPLHLTGSVRPGAPEDEPVVDLALTLAPTAVDAGPSSALLALEDGALRVPGDAPATRARLTGDLRVSDLELQAVDVAPIEGRLDARLFESVPAALDHAAAEVEDAAGPEGGGGAAGTPAGEGTLLDRLHATVTGPGVDARLAAGRVELDLAEHPVTVAEGTGTASVSLELPLSDPIDGLRGTADVQAGEASVRLEAAGEALSVEAALPAGADLAGRTLQEPLTLNLELPDRTAGEVTARLGTARLSGEVDLSAEVPFVGTLDTGESSLYLRVGRGPWRVAADGGAELGALTNALGLPGSGRLTASSFLLRPDGASGTAELDLEEPTAARLVWRNGELDGTLPTPVGDVRLEGTYRAGESPALAATHGWGRVEWTEEGLLGGGTIPERTWRGTTLEALPWSLGSEASDGRGPVEVDGFADLARTFETAEVRLGEEGAAGTLRLRDGDLQADLDLPARVGDEPARVTGTVRGGDGGLELDLEARGPGESLATVRGRPSDLAIALDAPAEVLAEAAGSPVDLAGTVSLTATADATSPSVDGVGSWRSGGEALDLTLTGPPWTAVARGPNVEASWTPGSIEVSADDATLGAFAPALAGVTLSGDLVRSTSDLDEEPLEDWRGELTLGDERFGTLRLQGTGESLTAEGSLAWQGVDLDVSGGVSPQVELALSALHEAAGVSADVDVSVRDGAPVVDGTVRWDALVGGPAELEAGEVRLEGTPADLRLQGPGGEVTLRGGRLAGSLSLPVRIDDVLHDLTIEPTGSPGEPSAVARLTGPAVQATATLGAEALPEGEASEGAAGGDAADAPWARLEARIEPSAWPAGLEAARLGAATVEARMDRSGAWTAAVDAAASPGDRPLDLRVDAEGTGAAGVASWSVRDPAAEGAVLTGTADFGRDGVAVQADLDTLDVAALASALGVDAEGDSSGRLTVGWNPGSDPALTVAGEARLVGSVAGVPVELEANRSEGRERVRLRSGDVEAVAERRQGAGDWSLQVAGDEVSLTGSLASDLHLLELSGTARGEPTNLRIARDADGPLLAIGSHAGARATVAVRNTEEGLRATVDASAPSRAALPAAGSLSASLALVDGAVEVERADVALVEPRSLRAELHGAAWPRADLRGVVHGLLPAAPDDDAPDSVALTVRGGPTDLEVRASVAGLTLDARLDGVAPERLALSGSGRSLFGVEVAPGEDPLTWTSDVGWSGRAELRVPRVDGGSEPEVHVDVIGTPNGLSLTANGAVDRPGLTATARADALLAGAPWDAVLTGEGRAQVEYAAGDENVRLDLPLGLEGTPLRPVLTGAPVLSGAVEASGTLRADPSGATLALQGPTVRLEASADGGGWFVDADVRELPLDPWIPALDEPRLDADVEATSGWGERPEELVGEWTLRATGGRATGTAVVGEGLSVTAEIDADLAVLLDGGAAGRIRGPLAIRLPPGAPTSEAEVSGSLVADGVEVGDLRVEGELALDGRLPVPDVAADLHLAGPVAGPVRVSWRPGDERVELVADVTAAGAHADVRVNGGPADLQASGRITYGAGVLDLSADDGAVLLGGRGAWSGVEARVRPFATVGEMATLRAPLARLVAAATATPDAPSDGAEGTLGGLLELSLRPYDDDWLVGTITGPEVAEVALPDLDLTARGTTLEARGDGPQGTVEAAVDLPDRSWRVALAGIELPGEISLDARGTGQGVTGSAEIVAREAADTEGEPASEVRATLARDERGFAVVADGALRGARLAMDLQRRDGVWQGPVEIVDLPTPAGLLSLSGEAAGDGPWPQAVVTTRLDGPVDAAGTVTAAPDAISVDVDATLPGGDTARLQGRVWPDPVLSLSGREGDQFRLTAESWAGEAPWSASGSTTLSLPGVDVVLEGSPESSAPRLTLLPQALPGGRLVTDLPRAAPLPALSAALDEGLVLRGEGDLTGEARWLPPTGLVANGLTWQGPWGSLALDGEVRDGDADVTGILTTTGAADGEDPPWLPSLLAAPFGDGPLSLRLEGDVDAARVEIVPADASRNGHAVVTWTGADRSLAIDIETEPLVVQASLRPDEGLTGRAELRGLPLDLPGLPDAALDGDLTATGATVAGQATLRGAGRVTVDGTTNVSTLLPPAYRPAGTGGAGGVAESTAVSLRAVDLNPADVPWLSRRLPGLSGGTSAVVEVRGSRVLVQVTAPDLQAGGRAVPLRLEGAGDLAGEGDLSFGGSLAGSSIQGSIDAAGLELLWRLERFPLQAPLEAMVGPLQVDVEATGVARIQLPFDGSAPPDVRLATERVRIERGGVVTNGTLSVELREGGFDVDADFSGDGHWTASGTIRPDDLDFTFEAVDADATPLLGLVPGLASLGAGAAGDLTVQAAGSYTDPRIVVRTNDLELALAGSRYRMTDTEAVLEGDDLRVQAVLEGVEPVGGRVVVAGEGQLSLAPWRLQDAAIRIDGGLNLPMVGAITEVSGVVRADAEGRPRLDLDGRMGAPLRVEGTLWPLDLDVRGQGLQLRVPTLMLASSTSDVDLNLNYDGLFHLTGRIDAREGRFSLGIRPRPDATAAATPGAAGPTGAPAEARAARAEGAEAVVEAAGEAGAFDEPNLEAGADGAGAEPLGGEADVEAGAVGAGDGGGEPTPSPRAGADREPNQALARFLLDLAVSGRRLSFSENFGSAEFEADLRIGGTAAGPRVAGAATAQRGTFRFSGREFELVRAVAEFEPSRGAYPTLDVEAVTRFEKRDVLGSAAAGVSFEAPSGSSFQVRLAFDAEVLPTPGEARAFRLDLDPVLTSDAVVASPNGGADGEGLTSGGRALTEAELVSLVALGRLDLSGELAGTSGVAGGVAQSALDSAVDLLILSEIQSALSDALGLDLVEIRTSTLSSVLDGGDDPFGVSLRLGGYLSEALFASVEVSRFGETSRELALTNTLNLTYELGPVEFDLQTRLGFAGDADLTPAPEVSAAFRYQITPFVAIETGATVSTPESEARFGVTMRW